MFRGSLSLQVPLTAQRVSRCFVPPAAAAMSVIEIAAQTLAARILCSIPS